jgi:hypothetical protein
MAARRELVAEVTDCFDEALRLQSRVMELTERVHQAAGLVTSDRAMRGRVTGLFFGLLAHLEELGRLAREEP